MRVLLDACIPQRLRHHLSGVDVQSAKFAGLDSLLDWELLDAAAYHFDVLITCDRSIRWQNNMAGRPIAVLVLVAPTNRLPDLMPLVPLMLERLRDLKPGDVQEVG